MQGFLNVYKPSGITSAKVVYLLRKKLNIQKIGHLGTLDPLACGVLPIAINKATKMFDYFLNKFKVYRAVFTFGTQTDSYDSTGIILNQREINFSKDDILEALKKLTGKISQVPPLFSAKNIDGKRAYLLARSGENVALKPSIVEVIEFKLLKQINKFNYEFLIKCSSGTYIRSLANDLGLLLNNFAHMSFLERVESGVFNLENSIELEKLLHLSLCEIDKLIIPVDIVFNNFNKLVINKNQFYDIINGRKHVTTNDISDNTFLYYNDKLLGVCERGNILKLKTNLMSGENYD